jgi:hypothetical protein
MADSLRLAESGFLSLSGTPRRASISSGGDGADAGEAIAVSDNGDRFP